MVYKMILEVTVLPETKPPTEDELQQQVGQPIIMVYRVDGLQSSQCEDQMLMLIGDI